MSYEKDLAVVLPNFTSETRMELWAAWCNYGRETPATQAQLEEYIKPVVEFWRGMSKK